ncbi:DUF4440 domain-containing protein [Kibdelosporangium persicum]|uniref:Ketosteroid isomerase-like n=1 Tax=Kibdelosporangium persicum TaxID=2698649 RepID=A0ABX2F7W6_9PSEU|nr:DUF4440 domain-containing protein [Kibdelosporangium persicum]NRN67055.1 Ketosteroid isomerase-like [Kibdelosporangium persicum]
MTNTLPHVELATDPAGHTEVFVQAFNSGDIERVRQLFDPKAVFVPEPGKPVTGEEIISRTKEFLDGGLPLSATTRHVYDTGDGIALLIVDWVIEGTTPDGEHVRTVGTGTDVVRRGPDGKWRYLVDSPFGTARADAE